MRVARTRLLPECFYTSEVGSPKHETTTSGATSASGAHSVTTSTARSAPAADLSTTDGAHNGAIPSRASTESASIVDLTAPAEKSVQRKSAVSVSGRVHTVEYKPRLKAALEQGGKLDHQKATRKELQENDNSIRRRQRLNGKKKKGKRSKKTKRIESHSGNGGPSQGRSQLHRVKVRGTSDLDAFDEASKWTNTIEYLVAKKRALHSKRRVKRRSAGPTDEVELGVNGAFHIDGIANVLSAPLDDYHLDDDKNRSYGKPQQVIDVVTQVDRRTRLGQKAVNYYISPRITNPIGHGRKADSRLIPLKRTDMHHVTLEGPHTLSCPTLPSVHGRIKGKRAAADMSKSESFGPPQDDSSSDDGDNKSDVSDADSQDSQGEHTRKRPDSLSPRETWQIKEAFRVMCASVSSTARTAVLFSHNVKRLGALSRMLGRMQLELKFHHFQRVIQATFRSDTSKLSTVQLSDTFVTHFFNVLIAWYGNHHQDQSYSSNGPAPVINLATYMRCLRHLLRSSPEERASFAYDCYDLDRDGIVSHSDLFSLVKHNIDHFFSKDMSVMNNILSKRAHKTGEDDHVGRESFCNNTHMVSSFIPRKTFQNAFMMGSPSIVVALLQHFFLHYSAKRVQREFVSAYRDVLAQPSLTRSLAAVNIFPFLRQDAHSKRKAFIVGRFKAATAKINIGKGGKASKGRRLTEMIQSTLRVSKLIDDSTQDSIGRISLNCDTQELDGKADSVDDEHSDDESDDDFERFDQQDLDAMEEFADHSGVPYEDTLHLARLFQDYSSMNEDTILQRLECMSGLGRAVHGLITDLIKRFPNDHASRLEKDYTQSSESLWRKTLSAEQFLLMLYEHCFATIQEQQIRRTSCMSSASSSSSSSSSSESHRSSTRGIAGISPRARAPSVTSPPQTSMQSITQTAQLPVPATQRVAHPRKSILIAGAIANAAAAAELEAVLSSTQAHKTPSKDNSKPEQSTNTKRGKKQYKHGSNSNANNASRRNSVLRSGRPVAFLVLQFIAVKLNKCANFSMHELLGLLRPMCHDDVESFVHFWCDVHTIDFIIHSQQHSIAVASAYLNEPHNQYFMRCDVALTMLQHGVFGTNPRLLGHLQDDLVRMRFELQENTSRCVPDPQDIANAMKMSSHDVAIRKRWNDEEIRWEKFQAILHRHLSKSHVVTELETGCDLRALFGHIRLMTKHFLRALRPTRKGSACGVRRVSHLFGHSTTAKSSPLGDAFGTAAAVTAAAAIWKSKAQDKMQVPVTLQQQASFGSSSLPMRSLRRSMMSKSTPLLRTNSNIFARVHALPMLPLNEDSFI
jgi:hypothetical protein